MEILKHTGLLCCFFLFSLISTEVRGQDIHLKVVSDVNAGRETADSLYYSPGRLLEWDDFKGEVDSTSVAAAVTFSGFAYQFRARSSREKLEINLYRWTYFNKNKSWPRPEWRTPKILAHEQLHFDITRITAEELRRALLSSSFSKNNYKQELAQLFYTYQKKAAKTQDEYDRDTRHGLDSLQQANWANRINQALIDIASHEKLPTSQ